MKNSLFIILLGLINLSSCEAPSENDSINIEWIEKFGVVINGEGVSEALGYNYSSNSTPHKIVLIGMDGKPFENYNENLPQNWLSNSIEETQLVGICQQYWKIVQVCEYGVAGTLQRKRRRDCVEINLYDAKTGEPAKNTIYEAWGINATILGTMPPICPSTTSLGEGYLDGERVLFKDIIDWLKIIVES